MVKKGSTFVWVFAIALLLFVGGGLLAGAGFFDTDDAAVRDEDVFLQSTDVGQVGEAQPDHRTITLGQNGRVAVGETRTTFVAERVDTFTVSQRPFTGTSRSFSFDAENPQTAVIRFEIGSTNALANLQVLVNDEVVLDQVKTQGSIVEVAVRTDTLRAGENTVTFTAEPSYMQFWRENRYLLQDFELVVTDTNRRSVTFPFRVFEYEAENFDTAALSFTVEESVVTDDLRIAVNGNTVYSDQPARSIEQGQVYEVNFTRLETDLGPGENTVTFTTSDTGAYVLQNTALTVQYFVGRERATATVPFTVSSYQYDRLQNEDVRGELRFTVSAVDTDRGLTATLGNKTFSFDTVTPQTYARPFDAVNVQPGNNTVSFQTTGSYTVEDVRVTAVERQPEAQ